MMKLDQLPSKEELSKAIDNLRSCKPQGSDGIPPEVINPQYELLRKCWEEGAVSQVTRDANIITLYKNKGEKSDCNNYRGISLLSIAGKLFARLVPHTHSTTC